MIKSVEKDTKVIQQKYERVFFILYMFPNKLILTYLTANIISSAASSCPSGHPCRLILSTTWMTLRGKLEYAPAFSGSSLQTMLCSRGFCGALWQHTSTVWREKGSGRGPARPSSLNLTACMNHWRHARSVSLPCLLPVKNVDRQVLRFIKICFLFLPHLSGGQSGPGNFSCRSVVQVELDRHGRRSCGILCPCPQPHHHPQPHR